MAGGSDGRMAVRGARTIGLISDTHGLLRPEAVAALRGVERIIHAGDVGGREVVESLGAIAPVCAVRGNNDRDAFGRTLPEAALCDLGGGVLLYVLHDLHELDLDPSAAGVSVVVSGHSHKPHVERRGDVLYVNPGSAGPRRFTLPIALALLRVDGAALEVESVRLV